MTATSDAIFDREPGKVPQYFVAVWLGTEAVDTNLSRIRTPFGHIRFVQKLSHVTSLISGDSVLCTTNPCVILGIVIGDVTKAEL